jgi:hypothetical protein
MLMLSVIILHMGGSDGSGYHIKGLTVRGEVRVLLKPYFSDVGGIRSNWAAQRAGDEDASCWDLGLQRCHERLPKSAPGGEEAMLQWWLSGRTA